MGSGYKDFAPGDVLAAADVDGYLMRQTMMTFADAATRDTALSGVLDEGMIAYLEDDNLVTVYNGTEWKVINSTEQTYALVAYTATGTFVKADYPWARSVKVRVVGGGGGSGGCGVTTSAQGAAAGGGGGGGYSEQWQQIHTLAASETVTVGVGGAAGASTPAAGSQGADSSFGTFAVGEGGAGGAGGGGQIAPVRGGNGGGGGAGSAGDLNVDGDGGGAAMCPAITRTIRSPGGGTVLGAAHRVQQGTGQLTSLAGLSYGGGAAGGCNGPSLAAQTGAAGADGIVIVEMFG
jgi:hypothetical protein